MLLLLKIFHTAQLIYKLSWAMVRSSPWLKREKDPQQALEEYLKEGIRLTWRCLQLRMSQLGVISR